MDILSTEMRHGLLTAARAGTLGAFLGTGPREIPRGTAKALERRRLAVIDGSRVTLTPAGQVFVEEITAAHRRILDDHS